MDNKKLTDNFSICGSTLRQRGHEGWTDEKNEREVPGRKNEKRRVRGEESEMNIYLKPEVQLHTLHYYKFF